MVSTKNITQYKNKKTVQEIVKKKQTSLLNELLTRSLYHACMEAEYIGPIRICVSKNIVQHYFNRR